MLTDTELFDHVRNSIGTALGADSAELTPETRLFGELGVDSVDLLDISYEIERLTGCELELAEMLRQQDGVTQPGRDVTLAQLVDLLKARLAGAPTA